MSLNYCVLGIDQTPPPSPPSPIHPLLPLSLSTSPPVSYSSLRIVFCLHLSVSLSLFYMRLCVVVPLPPSLSVLYSSLYWASLPSPLFLSLSLSERLLILMCLSSSLPPYLPSSTFFYLSFTTDLFSAPLFIPLSGSLSLIIAFTQPSLHLSPSLSLFFLSLFSALCSCSVFIYYCSVDNSLLCLQPYSHLSD